MSKDKVIVIGAGSENASLRASLEKLFNNGEEIVFVSSYKDIHKCEIGEMPSIESESSMKGTTITNDDVVNILESIPKESKKIPLNELLKETPKTFVLKNHRYDMLTPFIDKENRGPIGSILVNKKKSRK